MIPKKKTLLYGAEAFKTRKAVLRLTGPGAENPGSTRSESTKEAKKKETVFATLGLVMKKRAHLARST